MKYLIIFCLMLIIMISHQVFAENTVLINEFVIEPSPQSVEIINTGTESADISGWHIDDAGGSTFYTIPSESIILPNSCLIFSADFNFNKSSSDTVRLFDKTAVPTSLQSILIDSFSYKSSSGSGISYFRLPDGENIWQSGQSSLGKHNATKLTCLISPTLTPTINITPTPTAIPTPNSTATQILSPTPYSFNNIFISEVMVNPAVGEKEWVELFNKNDFPVTLINWHIDDLENEGSSPKTFSINIQANNYAVFELISSVFNNSGDAIRLLDYNLTEKDSFEYDTSDQGKTFGKVSSDSSVFCLQQPSKNQANNSCISPTTTPQSTPTGIPTTIQQSMITTNKSTSTMSTKKSTLVNRNYYIPSVSTGPLTQGEILGATNRKSDKTPLRSLSFVSFSYSVLTIISILLKMKS